MSERTPIGSITITYDVAEDGDLITGWHVDGDIPLVVGLGLLDMTRDSMLRDDEEEDQ